MICGNEKCDDGWWCLSLDSIRATWLLHLDFPVTNECVERQAAMQPPSLSSFFGYYLGIHGGVRQPQEWQLPIVSRGRVLFGRGLV